MGGGWGGQSVGGPVAVCEREWCEREWCEREWWANSTRVYDERKS